MGLFNNIKFFVLCHGMLQLAQLLVSGYLKGSISTIEKRYGFSSQMSGLLASFNEVGNTVLIVFVSYFGSRVHRPRCIGIGAMIASLAAFLIALPHFLSGEYKPKGDQNTSVNVSGLCRAVNVLQAESSNQTCSETDGSADLVVFPILLLGQLLLGIGGVPIQPFGISYVDDYANKKDSPLYLGILFAVTVIGPAFGYLMSSSVLQLYVDFNTLGAGSLKYGDAHWVGAWWLGFLVAGALLFLTSLPYLFFPREMEREETIQDLKSVTKTFIEKKELGSKKMDEFSLLQFIKRFPQIMLRTLKNPIYLLVVLAQVNLAAMVAGVATFMPKFIERQFTKTAAFSNVMIGGFIVPSAMLGIMAGGMVFRRLRLSVQGSAAMCVVVVLMGGMFAFPLLFLGCSTQRIAGIYPDKSQLDCSLECSCSNEAFNPVCGSNGIEYRSPCHAGCRPQSNTETENYTACSCVKHESSNLHGFAVPSMCDNGCAPLLIPFMLLCSLSCLLVSFSQTPSFMMILRTVKPEDKSFALGIQYMLFRVLAFLPSPVLYGTTIDSTCILWGEKCKKVTSCHYYDLDLFRQRFLGLQTFFVFGGLVFFLLSFFVLKRIDSAQLQQMTQDSSVTTEKKGQETILQKASTVPTQTV